MPIRVLASVIQRDKLLLVCRRPLHKRHGGLWEFPGGKVREGESDLEAARRELLEELGGGGDRGGGGGPQRPAVPGVSPGRRGKGGWVG